MSDNGGNAPAEAKARGDHIDEMMAMLKRRGYIAPAYELYGGTAGFYDYGPLGGTFKLNFENLWRKHYVLDEGFAEIHSPTISPGPVFKASGHLASFADLLIECPHCEDGLRADHCLRDEFERLANALDETVAKLRDKFPDHVAELDRLQEGIAGKLEANQNLVEHGVSEAQAREILCLPDDSGQVTPAVVETYGPFTVEYRDSTCLIKDEGGKTLFLDAVRCIHCGGELATNENTGVYQFNLMFKTSIGPGQARAGYLRPETAQGMFVNFDWIYRYHRERLPFGAVQLGKAYRNEIAPRSGLIRLREFHQAELEYFVDPDQKDHPRFDEVADLELPLLPDGGTQTPMRLGDAIDKGIIANTTLAYFIAKTYRILTEAGLDPDAIRFRQHESDEMAHYAADCWDAEYRSARYGWVECVGIADRGCYDLESHAEVSGERLAAFRRFDEPVERELTKVTPDMGKLGPKFKGDAGKVAEALQDLEPGDVPEDGTVEVTLAGEDGRTVEVPVDAFTIETVNERVDGEHVVPHVIEPSYGVDRILYAALEHSFDPSGEWAVLRMPPLIAPLTCGVFPLLSKDGLPEMAHGIDRALRAHGIRTYYDEGGSIGRRYARMDEVGTPWCITVDHEGLEDGTVTVRDRDSQAQVRAPAEGLAPKLAAMLRGELTFDALGPELGADARAAEASAQDGGT